MSTNASDDGSPTAHVKHPEVGNSTPRNTPTSKNSRPAAISQNPKASPLAGAAPVHDAVPISESDDPSLSIYLLEEGTLLPMSRVSMWLWPEDSDRAITGFTNNQGILHHEHIPAGRYQADVKLGNQEPVNVGTIEYQGDQHEEVFTLYYPAFGERLFEVLHPETREPIVGMKLLVGHNFLPPSIRKPNQLPRETGFFQEVETDSSGRFTAKLNRDHPYIEVHALGHGLITLPDDPYEREKIEIVINPEENIEEPITILARTGGVSVVGFLENPPPLSPGERYVAMVQHPVLIMKDEYPVQEGRFQFTAIAGERYTVSIGRKKAEQNAWLKTDASVGIRIPRNQRIFEFDIPMQGDKIINGKAITPDGQPVEGIPFLITCLRKQENTGRMIAIQQVSATTTNEQGEFKANVFECDEYSIEIESQLGGYGGSIYSKAPKYSLPEPVKVTKEHIEDKEAWEITIYPARVLWGEILSPDGTPANEAIVQIVTEKGIPIGKYETTDQDGLFLINVPTEYSKVLLAAGKVPEGAESLSEISIAMVEAEVDSNERLQIQLPPRKFVSIPFDGRNPDDIRFETFMKPLNSENYIRVDKFAPPFGISIERDENEDSNQWKLAGVPGYTRIVQFDSNDNKIASWKVVSETQSDWRDVKSGGKLVEE